jgi:uncharacterized protein with PQ loop repeat
MGGALLGFAPWQQLWKAFRTKKTKDISLKACLCVVVGLSLSITYTAYNKILPILIPTSVEMLAWVILIIFKMFCLKYNMDDTQKDTERDDEICNTVSSINLEHSLIGLTGSIRISSSPETDDMISEIEHIFRFADEEFQTEIKPEIKPEIEAKPEIQSEIVL